MLHLPRVYYIPSGYVSHRRAGEGYQTVLEELGCLTSRLDEAQVALIHAEADAIPMMLRRMPAIASRYCVGLSVWETDRLPAAYLPGLDAMDEIWTPSSYAASALWRAGHAAWWLPHVTAEPTSVSAAARKTVATWLGPEGPSVRPFTFLYVTKPEDPRKDLLAMERAFCSFRRHCPHARLILKTGCLGRPAAVRRRPGLVDMVQDASHEEMAALREQCDVVVSSHRGEGWGLTLSEAMSEGRLAVAPAYSGNMTFMSHANSLLVLAGEVRVGLSAHHFEPDMHWGQVAIGALTDALVQAYELRCNGKAAARCQQARKDLRRYARRKNAILMKAYLQRIAAMIETGWHAPSRDPSPRQEYFSNPKRLNLNSALTWH